MKRRQLLCGIGGGAVAATGSTAGCTELSDLTGGWLPGQRLASVSGYNQGTEDHMVEVAIEFDGERVAEGILEFARHRTGEVSPTDDLECTWPTDELGPFTIRAHLPGRDETVTRSTDDEYAPDHVCQRARITVDDDEFRVALWGCDGREDPPAGFNCEGGDFGW